MVKHLSKICALIQDVFTSLAFLNSFVTVELVHCIGTDNYINQSLTCAQ